MFIELQLAGNSNIRNVNFLLNELGPNFPAPEDFDTIFASSAMDTCGVISETLSFMLDKKSERMNDISTISIDTVDMYVREILDLDPKDKNMNSIIDDHFLMKREIEFQERLIEYLSAFPILNEDNVKELKSFPGMQSGSLYLDNR